MQHHFTWNAYMFNTCHKKYSLHDSKLDSLRVASNENENEQQDSSLILIIKKYSHVN